MSEVMVSYIIHQKDPNAGLFIVNNSPSGYNHVQMVHDYFKLMGLFGGTRIMRLVKNEFVAGRACKGSDENYEYVPHLSGSLPSATCQEFNSAKAIGIMAIDFNSIKR